jgi:DNA uptake protein ComE-like DNA-binding protein
MTIMILFGLLTATLAACMGASPAVTPEASSTSAASQSAERSNVNKLNLNTVTGDELLAAIPGFSSRMIREFQEYRPYVSIQQFRREIGKYVGEAQVAEYEQYVYVPVAINDSDAETLQQIPGLDAAGAQALISGRPYASVDDFLARLSGFIAADELEIAKTYLGDN